MDRYPGLKTIVQIAVVCRDIEATAKQWAAFLGVEMPKISTTGPGNECGMVYQGKPSNARCKLGVFRHGDVCAGIDSTARPSQQLAGCAG